MLETRDSVTTGPTRTATGVPDQRRRTGYSPSMTVHGEHDQLSERGDHDGARLLALAALNGSGAPEAEVAAAVKRALDNGWSWTPIAIVLHSTRAATIRRFARGVAHPVTRRRHGSGPQRGHEAEPVTPEQ